MSFTGCTAVALRLAGEIEYLVADLRAALRLTIISADRKDLATIEQKVKENDAEFGGADVLQASDGCQGRPRRQHPAGRRRVGHLRPVLGPADC